MEEEMGRVDYKMKKMVVFLKDCLRKVKCVGLELKHGQMERDMKENGKMAKCMGKESSFGKKAKCIRVNMSMELVMVMGNIVGQMEEHTKGVGKME
jgi:hypothetical protein